jgi:hypothetical protein
MATSAEGARSALNKARAQSRHMMPSRSLSRRAALAALLLVPLAAAPARIADQTFAERIRLADTELVLNGVGLRARFWFKGFAAGLYLTDKAATTEQVIARPGAKRIEMRMLIDVDSKEFVKAFEVGIRRNSSEAELAAFGDRIDRFDRAIAALGGVQKGDVIDLDFIPTQGLALVVNGKLRGEPIPGEDLYAGLLRCFLGDKPVDRALKAGLLGGR